MLNDDHRHNLQERADSVSMCIHKAWKYYQILEAMQQCAAQDQEHLEKHGDAFDAVYRAVFDALLAAVGNVLDTRKDTESLHTLVKMAVGYPIDPAVRSKIRAVQAATQESNGSPLARLKNWRHQHVAHHTIEAMTPAWYAENCLDLAEVERGIEALNTALSDISYPLMGARYLLRPDSERVAISCASLFGAQRPA